MFRYAFYRIYKHQQRIGKWNPADSAAIGWAAYIGIVYVPVSVLVLERLKPWIPALIVAHPAIFNIVVMFLVIAVANRIWVRSGAYAELGVLYDHEPPWVMRIRAGIFWLWAIAGPVLIAFVGFSGS